MVEDCLALSYQGTLWNWWPVPVGTSHGINWSHFFRRTRVSLSGDGYNSAIYYPSYQQQHEVYPQFSTGQMEQNYQNNNNVSYPPQYHTNGSECTGTPAPASSLTPNQGNLGNPGPINPADPNLDNSDLISSQAL